jgi:molybdate transport system substrate-binding protein
MGQTAQFVDSGTAQAGLISFTSALSPTLSSIGSSFIIPRNLYPALNQAAIVEKNSVHRAGRTKLFNFLHSAPI